MGPKSWASTSILRDLPLFFFKINLVLASLEFRYLILLASFWIYNYRIEL